MLALFQECFFLSPPFVVEQMHALCVFSSLLTLPLPDFNLLRSFLLGGLRPKVLLVCKVSGLECSASTAVLQNRGISDQDIVSECSATPVSGQFLAKQH